MKPMETEVLVIGSGAAGLFFSLGAARFADVTVITKKGIRESNTNYAQGGIASVMGGKDSTELHVSDTLAAGRGLCDREAVEVMVREGPARIDELVELGVRFSREPGNGAFKLGREGGHSASRVVHYGDVIGRELEQSLIRAVKSTPRIHIRDNHQAIDLIKDTENRVKGCAVLDRGRGEMLMCLARHTVIATGGAGKIYLYTSNPDVATGDGIAMAYNAGASIANLEFVQFHPTCLYHPDAKSQLISEALRGEGAVLRNQAGERFMKEYDTRLELAPRDIVARAIDSEMKKSGEKCVFLDITDRSPEWLKKRFPYVYESCLGFGIDIARDLIPVVPAAHYMCGGVKVDMNGRTDLEGLFAIGEAACSGVHGANRLASNSLLEALVIAHRCAAHLESEPTGDSGFGGIEAEDLNIADPKELESVILDHDWDLARRVMWDYVGIVRSDERLNIARERIGQIQKTVSRLISEYGISGDLIELRNIVLVSELVITSALARKESRGLHYMADYPASDPAWEKNTVIRKA